MNARRFTRTLQSLPLERGARPIVAALGLLLIALWMPALKVARDSFDCVVVFDVTQSMNVTDYEVDGRFVSRLDYARRSAKRALRDLPCGSRVGWAAFAEYRTVMLLAPIEVCANYHDLLASLDLIDGRLRWGNASEVAKGVFWALRAVKDLGTRPDLIFVTDGHESPPQTGTGPQLFDDLVRGQIHGWLLGAGGDTPQPIPRQDGSGKLIGYWRADDVVQRADPTTGMMATGSREHLSQMQEPHLRAIADKVGLDFARIEDADALGRAMRDPRHARRGQADAELAWIPAGSALGLLVFCFGPELRLRRRRSRIVRPGEVST